MKIIYKSQFTAGEIYYCSFLVKTATNESVIEQPFCIDEAVKNVNRILGKYCKLKINDITTVTIEIISFLSQKVK